MKKQYLVDVTEIFNVLGKEKKYRLIKLGFYVFLFFIVIYRYSSTYRTCIICFPCLYHICCIFFKSFCSILEINTVRAFECTKYGFWTKFLNMFFYTSVLVLRHYTLIFQHVFWSGRWNLLKLDKVNIMNVMRMTLTTIVSGGSLFTVSYTWCTKLSNHSLHSGSEIFDIW